MSESPAVRFENVGKMYKIFGSRSANLLDALGIRLPWHESRHRDFWALRGIDYEVRHGERLGIIGRNGAGKSTMLKLITGNLTASEGRVTVDGDVQALLEIGGGLHPEFTGRENIHAALVHLGLSPSEIEEAQEDIAEFTELGAFLDQPFKTYSMGMQARLSFAIGTTVKPEILIIDEILGAGDAYFFAKSTARMLDLLDSGASVLLVSHQLDQIERFCDEAIWLDRGRIAMRGPSTEVVKAYEKFIRELDDRRLRAKNRKSAAHLDAFERDSYTDHLAVRISTGPGARCDVSKVALFRDGQAEDSVSIGDAQDADPTQSGHVQLDAADWTPPERADDEFFRSLASEGSAVGTLIFYLWFFYPQSRYEIEITYRSPEAPVSVGLERGGRTGILETLPACEEWSTGRVALASASEGQDDEDSEQAATVSRWTGAGSLMIGDVRLLDESETEQAIFRVGAGFKVAVDIVARESGSFPLIPAALVFRTDGVVVTRHVGERVELEVARGHRVNAELDFGRLMLGNGQYLLSIGLYKKLDLYDLEPSEFYDYYDRSFEFAVIGNPPLHNEVVRHPGTWTVAAPAVPALAPGLERERAQAASS